MHLRATELFFVGVLVDGHLHQGRTTEIDLGGLLLQHHVVAHSRYVRAAGGRRSEDHRHRRDARRRQLREVLETGATGHEDLRLLRKVSAGGLGEADQRKPVLPRDVHGTQTLSHRRGSLCAALHRRIVGHDHALGTADRADPGHKSRSHRVLRPPTRQRAELKECTAGIQQIRDALAWKQFAPRTQAGDGAGILARIGRAATRGDGGLQAVHFGQSLKHRRAVTRELLGAGVDHRT